MVNTYVQEKEFRMTLWENVKTIDTKYRIENFIILRLKVTLKYLLRIFPSFSARMKNISIRKWQIK